jgi:ATP-dependent DNA helicase DinG
MFYDNYVVVDLETTGLSVESGARVVWISALKINGKTIVDKSFWILKSDTFISNSVGEIIGINQLDMKKAIPSELVLPNFFKFVRDLPVVTHQAAFVSEFMEYECSLRGYEGFLRYECTYELAKKAFPLERNSVDTLAKKFVLMNFDDTSKIYDDTCQVSQIYEQLKILLGN